MAWRGGCEWWCGLLLWGLYLFNLLLGGVDGLVGLGVARGNGGGVVDAVQVC